MKFILGVFRFKLFNNAKYCEACKHPRHTYTQTSFLQNRISEAAKLLEAAK